MAEAADDKPKRAVPVKAEMNVTPLVDIVLVLLIIFMVVMPSAEAGVTVALPSIVNPDKGNGAMEPTTVTLTKTGNYYFEKEKLEVGELMERLRKIYLDKPDTRVVLKADSGLPYGKVRALFKACQEMGFPGISLQVIDRANKRG